MLCDQCTGTRSFCRPWDPVSYHIPHDDLLSHSNTDSIDVDRVLGSLDNTILAHLDNTRSEKAIIFSGLAQVGLQEYLASINRVVFTLNSLSGTQISALQGASEMLIQLLQKAGSELEGTYKDALARTSQRVEPLAYITKSKLAFTTTPHIHVQIC
jgi:hypothetical protein